MLEFMDRAILMGGIALVIYTCSTNPTYSRRAGFVTVGIIGITLVHMFTGWPQ